jgi:acetoin utilization deacetylase AcuC-like enzyme
MPARRLFYCDHYAIPLPAGHKFPMNKYGLLRQALARDGCFAFEAAPAADPAVIELAHDPEYVRQVLSGSLPSQSIRRIGFPWSENLVRRTLASVGGTLAASDDALRYGFGGNLAGGTHHASRSEGSGFCVFNDIAVAIRQLRKRAAVVDLDVHQGDGTALIFEDDPSVLTVSLHGRHNFPFRKQRSKIDIEFPDGATDRFYLQELEQVLPQVYAFAPEVVFYQSGVDALEGDRLGRLSLTPSGLAERDRIVVTFCREHTLPLVITLGGGYADPIERTVEAHATTFRTAVRVFGAIH